MNGMNCMMRIFYALIGAMLSFAPAVAAAQAITVLSSRPDTVSDGNALISVSLPKDSTAADFTARVGNSDVTSSFQASGYSMVGLVQDLKLGQNIFTAIVRRHSASVVLINHGRDGPIFSGPHQWPFICETQDFKVPGGSTLGPPQDAACNAPSVVTFLYKPRSFRGLKLLPVGDPLPADLATTTTLDGRTVNYIVRVETGTLNRAIYQTAVLFDPTKGEKVGPLADHPGWNGRAVFVFGGGATAGYHQGASVGEDSLSDDMISRGFAVLSSSLSVMAVVGSDIRAAETASMVKEHFIKTFGSLHYIFGWGGSGGSMQQHLIANNYPGILDGIIPGSSFPDLYSLVDYPEDCALMSKVFDRSKTEWTVDEKRAATGLNTWGTCAQWNQFFVPELLLARQADPKVKVPGFKDSNCNAVVPRPLTYDAKRNRRGVRCDIFTASRNALGFDPRSGATYRTFDNVGVQYGLKAYQAGALSGERFVELNEGIGGIDNDGEFQAGRTEASLIGLRRMFETGRINEGENLNLIPIIDLRGNPVLQPNVHDAVNSEVMRARLLRTSGSARGQVLVRGEADPTAPGSGTVSGSAGMDLFALLKMDEWLASISADRRNYRTQADKVAANRPADLSTDVCIFKGGSRIDETSNVENKGSCSERLPYFSEPRLVAGEPLTRDILKCHLRPFRESDYMAMAPSLIARLRKVFPTGVCDYTKPSVGFSPLKGSWLSYPSPGIAVPMR
jgi:hypothetical protein